VQTDGWLSHQPLEGKDYGRVITFLRDHKRSPSELLLAGLSGGSVACAEGHLQVDWRLGKRPALSQPRPIVVLELVDSPTTRIPPAGEN
jgi:hypothetical protein